MATERQLRANRENAKRSTGPKSPAGRLISSQNALRHGLSATPKADRPFGTDRSALSQLAALGDANHSQTPASMDFLQAQAQLMRVASIRRELLADIDFEEPSLDQVRNLRALERYELRAYRQRRRAACRLSGGNPQQTKSWQNEPNLLGKKLPCPNSDA